MEILQGRVRRGLGEAMMDWSQLTLTEYVDLARKRIGVVAAIFIVTLGSTVIYSFRQKPVYQAIATISIGPDYYRKLPMDQFFAYDSESLFLQTQLQVLRSRPIAEGVARSLVQQGTLPGDGKTDWTAYVRGALTIERQADSRIFFIKARAPEPALARDIANATIRVYSDVSVDRVVEASRKSISWLTEQLVDLKKKVEDSEMSLIKYIEEENLTSSGDVPAIQGGGGPQPYSLGEDKTLQDLNGEMVKTELDLEKLKSRYGNKYPSVEYLRSEIGLIQAKLESEKKKLIEGNKKKIRFSILRREAELNKELYNIFMKELKETNVVAEMGMSNVTVINDAELPGGPVSPRKKFNMMIGIVMGLILGFGTAFAQEQLDRTLKTEDDVRHHLDLPLLAVIHKFQIEKSAGRPVLATDDPRSSSSESFRILRTNVKFSSPAGGGKMLLVTSAGPLEGKTTILTNIGNIMAQAGEKVLLLDTDLRRPRVHEVFRIPREPGMTNLLVEEGKEAREGISHTAYKNLDVLTCGPISPNPAELLESRRLKEIVEELKNSYDRILFDSPPIGLVTDASILASMVDGVIIVVQAGMLDRKQHQQAKSQLEKTKVKIYGVVLNNIKPGRGKDYRYHYYYSETSPVIGGGGPSPSLGDRPGE